MKTTMIGAAFLLLGMLAPSFAQDKSKDFTSSVGIKMIWVKPGSVKVDPKTLVDDDEFKQVTVKSGYYLAATEVTEKQYKALMKYDQSIGENAPVEYVTWKQAMEYCRRLTEKDRASGKLPKGYIYTLPTEMQWEYACRSGTTGHHAGPLDEMAWHDGDVITMQGPDPVATKRANRWGFYDMHGNVMEWCLDRRLYEDGGTGRPARGGTWYNYDIGKNNSSWHWCRSGARGFVLDEDYKGTYWVGFRPAAVPSSK